MNIQEAKTEICNTLRAYLARMRMDIILIL